MKDSLFHRAGIRRVGCDRKLVKRGQRETAAKVGARELMKTGYAEACLRFFCAPNQAKELVRERISGMGLRSGEVQSGAGREMRGRGRLLLSPGPASTNASKSRL